MPNIEKLLDVASNDIPAQFPKINRGVDIASEGLDLANTRLNDAQGYLTSAQERVGDYQEAAGRAQEVNNQANSALRQQSTSGLPQYQIQKLSTDSSQDTVNDNQIVSNNDVKSMNSALAEALLTLSSNSDNQAKATQSDIKALKDISYGVIGSNRPTEFNDMLRNLKTRLENSSKSNQQLIDVLKELEKENMSIYRRKLNKLRVPIIVSPIHYVQRINSLMH